MVHLLSIIPSYMTTNLVIDFDVLNELPDNWNSVGFKIDCESFV